MQQWRMIFVLFWPASHVVINLCRLAKMREELPVKVDELPEAWLEERCILPAGREFDNWTPCGSRQQVAFALQDFNSRDSYCPFSWGRNWKPRRVHLSIHLICLFSSTEKVSPKWRSIMGVSFFQMVTDCSTFAWKDWQRDKELMELLHKEEAQEKWDWPQYPQAPL